MRIPLSVTPELFSMTRYPKSGLDERVPEFLERFFRISDDPQSTENYFELFTADVRFKSGSLALEGIEGWHSGCSLLMT